MLPMVGGCSNAIQEKIGGKNPGGKHFIEFLPANKKISSSDFIVMFYPQTSVTSSTCETCFFVPQLRNIQKSMQHETKKPWLVEDPYH